MFARSVPRFTVNGAPDSSRTMPFTCQSEPSFDADPLPLPPKFGSA